MSDGTTTELTACLERLRAGDTAARDALITRAQARLRSLTRKQMQKFDRIRRFDDTDDVLQNATIRLLRRLQARTPADPAEFFAQAAREIRCELLDLARSHYGPQGAGRREANLPELCAVADLGQSTHDPGRLSRWQEFHEQAEQLPPEERSVFEMRWYHGMTRLEIAAVLKISEATVKRRWLDACLRLREILSFDLDAL
jgi:RNA polymerase sigma-70 factor (ECF subfamily)